MSRSCLALLSGGLDGLLAARLMQQQGIRVRAASFVTPLTRHPESVALMARRWNMPLTTLRPGDDYLELLRGPRRERPLARCLNCRVYIFQAARRLMRELTVDFLVSGEVLGQRASDQKRADLDAILALADLEDILLRPLSAKLLRPTLAEREGWVNRETLHCLSGRGRKELIRLARDLGVDEIPPPSPGCEFAEPVFAQKAKELHAHQTDASWWDYELLRLGRHFRLGDRTKAIVGRSEEENAALQALHQRSDGRGLACLSPVGFHGPVVLLAGDEERLVNVAAALLWRFSRQDAKPPIEVRVGLRRGAEIRNVTPDAGLRHAALGSVNSTR